MNLVPGTLIDRYRVESEIGRGGMARVYRVRHKNLDTLHALKVLTVAGEEVRERLMREGKLQSSLDHPNILPVRDVIEIGEGHGLLMDFIDGPSLDAWVIEEHPDVAERERVFLEILAGVEFAHGRGVVHRDLKPGNVMMERRHGQWHPRVVDFGLAKVIGGDETDDVSQSRTGRPMGTPAYMSPEQVRSAKHVDHRADVFALGCILYELMCQRRAFTGSDSLEVFNRVTQGRFQPPRELVSGLPPRIEAAMLGALAVQPEDRIPNCATLALVFSGEQTWTLPDRPGVTFYGMDFTDESEGASGGASSHARGPSGEPTPSGAVAVAGDTLAFSGTLTFHPVDEAPPPVPRGGRSRVLAGALVVAAAGALCFGAWGLTRSSKTSRSEVSAPAPAVVAPTPLPSPVSPPPPPVADPAPTAPAQAAPVVAPVAPAPRAAPTPVARTGRIRFTGDASTARLRDSDGTLRDAGEVPPGSYLIEASFDAGPPMHAGNVVVRAGDVLALDCRSETQSCSP